MKLEAVDCDGVVFATNQLIELVYSRVWLNLLRTR